ncbi:MAG: hypothetical protein HOD63_14115 [Bacteroidetes bacterium]|nr:hypothetical protein [Bacteroidota bacterium]MBT5529025.1 hypothetical protein [Cytophagia bacterium]MBT7825777.1 hypothetical protein [Bacteroidota bacterium]MBT7995121.1 hypothetical protein [Bacteroidota bacterium]
MRKTIFLPFILLLFSSCIVTRTPGFYIGYNQLTDSEKQNIEIVDQDSCICNLGKNGKIHVINGEQLRDCLKSNDTSIIFKWGPNCSSKSCILISACQDYCSLKNYNLYVIADYYDIKKMQSQNVSDFPMLIANHNFYKRQYANSLNKKFINDVLNGQSINKENMYNRFLLFKGDKLIKSMNNLFEIH